MFSFFKNKIKEIKPKQHAFNMQFKVVYKLSDGNERATGVINISVPASNEVEAKNKLEAFAAKHIEIRVMRCEK